MLVIGRLELTTQVINLLWDGHFLSDGEDAPDCAARYGYYISPSIANSTYGSRASLY